MINSAMQAGSAGSSVRVATVRVWDLPVRLFHWILVATILVAFLSSDEGSALAPWHIPAGWLAAVLIAFRLVWGLVGGEHARFRAFLRPGEVASHIRRLIAGKLERSVGHNALGGLAIVALLTTLAGVVYSGATISGGNPEQVHELFANLLLALVALHIVAVIAMSTLTGENLIVAFLTGRKRADLHPGAVDARPPASLAIPAAVVIIGGAAYGATLIDPVAFAPGSHASVDAGVGQTAEGSDSDE